MEAAQTFQLTIDKLKRQYGDEAIFVSRDGVRFNAFDEKWLLSSDRTSGNYIDMVWLYEYPLPLEQCIDLRLTLAKSTQKNKLETLRGRRAMLLSVQLTGLDEISIKKAAAHEENLTYNKRLKAVCKQLSADYPDKYDHLAHIFDDVALGNAPRKVHCEIRGALSEYEYYDLAEKLNNQAKDILNGEITDFDTIKAHVCYRFEQLFCARHSQVSMLKIGDFKSNEESFLAARELTFKLPLVKQQDDAQMRIFGIKKNYLSGTALQAFLRYLRLYQEKMQHIFEQQGYELSIQEFSAIFKCLPVIPHQSLFQSAFGVKLKTSGDLVDSFSPDNHGFNYPAKSMKALLMRFIARLNIQSDRVMGKIDVGVNRLRHTTAVHMAVDNKSRDDIALMLENTPKAADVYIDLSDELRAAIDAGLSNHTMVAKAFSGKLTTDIEQNELVIEGETGCIGKSGSAQTCMNCSKSRPLACYGCQFFRPLIGANHLSYLKIVESRFQQQVDKGISTNVLAALRNKILTIKATIYACQLAKDNHFVESK